MTINYNGITIPALQEIIAELSVKFKAIYGDDINIDQNSPDGQLLNVFAQAIRDKDEKLIDLYNSFAPNANVGQQQDRTYVLNGIKRKAGTYTQVNVLISVNKTVTLKGLDNSFSDPNGTGYTVKDAEDNQFILANTSTVGASSGSALLSFRARQMGEIEALPNSINIPVDIILGVVGVNNPQAEYIRGTNEETDDEFRHRRALSTAIASSGIIDGLKALLLDIEGVKYAEVYENVENETDADEQPPHSIWVVVQGGSDADIGRAIYLKHNEGCNMYGNITVNVPRAAGFQGTFPAKFDRPVNESLHIRFDIESLDLSAIDEDYIKNSLQRDYKLGVGEKADTSVLTALVKGIVPNNLPYNMQVSNDGTTWEDAYVSPTSKINIFTVDPANITITETTYD